MPLVTSEEMLSKAQEGGYAVGAFNAENMEMYAFIWITAAALNWRCRQCTQGILPS